MNSPAELRDAPPHSRGREKCRTMCAGPKEVRRHNNEQTPVRPYALITAFEIHAAAAGREGSGRPSRVNRDASRCGREVPPGIEVSVGVSDDAAGRALDQPSTGIGLVISIVE